ncbi:MAG: dihydropteroate synthase [Deltaproteobacteria bacterium]|nr:dihydropteroate synthase [Deltaproteobacteria bacterium]
MRSPRKIPKIMGILNITPDSFSDGGCYFDLEKAFDRARAMAEEGADIIDIGGESTRPGALHISAEEELKRVLPLVEKLSQTLSIPLSIDTMKHEVAAKALEKGVSIVNDISGLKGDPEMKAVVAHFKPIVVLMHSKGTPQTMKGMSSSVEEVYKGLSESIEIAQGAQLSDEKIIIDPGLGFGKTFEDNWNILKKLDAFLKLKYKILLGASRKSFLGKQDSATHAVTAWAVFKGADYVRVHNVRETKEFLKVFEKLYNV